MAEVPLEFEAMAIPFLQGNNSLDHEASFGTLLGNILGIVMIIALLILLFFFVWGAIEWMTSGGESSKLQSARDRMVHAVVGILVLSASLALFMFVQYLLGVDVIRVTSGPNSGRGACELTDPPSC
jgi:hypothetical protein